MVKLVFQFLNNMNINMIAVIGKNNELGKNGKLIWNLPNDLKFFKDTTMGYPVVMGRKTFESLPKMLPGRKHIVLSSGKNFPECVDVYNDIFDFLWKYLYSDQNFFVIGGGQIYKEFIDVADSLYLTEVDATCKKADTFFPEFDYEDYKKEILDEQVENGLAYKHVLYRRY